MQNKPTVPEKRCCDRRAISTDIMVTFHNRTYYSQTRDIGLGGMFIDLDAVLIPGGAHVEIAMLQYRNNRSYTIFDTRVAYVTPRGYGLYFSDFDIQEFRHLQEILYESADQAIKKLKINRI
jgi:hypothetical protein